MKLKPLNDFVIVELKNKDTDPGSLIYIPDMLKEKADRATVVAVGPGILDSHGKKVEMGVAEGDEILYVKNTGQRVQVDKVDYLVLKKSNIMAIIAN